MSTARDEAKNLTFPSPPELVFKLLGLVDRDKVDFQRVANIVSLDAKTAAVLVGLANSASYSATNRVTTLDQAIRTIGIDLSISTAISAALTNSLGLSVRPRKVYRAVWLDGVLRAIIARRLAQTLRPNLCGQAYLVGLFQQMGVLALIANVKGYHELLEEADGDMQRLNLLEREMFGRTNTEVLAELCTVWELPSLISDAMMPSTRPDPEPQDDDLGFLSQVSYLVRSAPPLQGENERVGPQLELFAQQAFGLNNDGLHALLVECKDDFQAGRSTLGSTLPISIDGVETLDRLAAALSSSSETGDWLNHAPVIVISPSKAQRMVVAAKLRAFGVRKVVDTASGKEALELLDELEARLIISARDSSDLQASDLWTQIEEKKRPWNVRLLVMSFSDGSVEEPTGTKTRVVQMTNHPETMWHAIHHLRMQDPASV